MRIINPEDPLSGSPAILDGRKKIHDPIDVAKKANAVLRQDCEFLAVQNQSKDPENILNVKKFIIELLDGF